MAHLTRTLFDPFLLMLSSPMLVMILPAFATLSCYEQECSFCIALLCLSMLPVSPAFQSQPLGCRYPEKNLTSSGHVRRPDRDSDIDLGKAVVMVVPKALLAARSNMTQHSAAILRHCLSLRVVVLCTSQLVSWACMTILHRYMNIWWYNGTLTR